MAKEGCILRLITTRNQAVAAGRIKEYGRCYVCLFIFFALPPVMIGMMHSMLFLQHLLC